MHSIHHSSIVQPKTMLVATDLTDLDFLLPVAIDQARATGAMVWLLHVMPPERALASTDGGYPVLQKTAFRHAEAVLARVAFDLKTLDISCAFEVRRWYPVDRVIEFVRERHIDRVILGTSSKGKLGKLLLGSVAEQLIRSLDVPVCTVGPHFKPLPQSKPRRVMLATSLRHDFEKTVEFAAKLVTALPADLTILHVMEQDRPDDGVDLRIVSKIDEMLKDTQPIGVTPQLCIRYGEPSEEILLECSALKPELLVLGSVTASALVSTFRSGVTYRVIAEAPCPTFTLRTGSRRSNGGVGREVSAIPGSG